MDFEIDSILQPLGLLACACASVYLIYKDQRKVGLIFLSGFILILQANLSIFFFGLDPVQGECWAEHGSYYKCQPLIEKLSFHGAHLGFLVLAYGIVILGLKPKKN